MLFCPYCNGSGLGQVDGCACYSCYGTGDANEATRREIAEDEDDDDDDEDM